MAVYYITLAKISQEKRRNPGKAWRPWLSWLFPAFFDAGKPGKARKARKFLAFLERPECSSKKSLESQERALGFRGNFAESVDFAHTNRTQKSQERQE